LWRAESPDYTPSTPKTGEVFSLYYTPALPEYTPVSSSGGRGHELHAFDTQDRRNLLPLLHTGVVRVHVGKQFLAGGVTGLHTFYTQDW
jgi:hypothetical protein